MALGTLSRSRGLTEPTRRGGEHWLLAGHYDPEFVSGVEAKLDDLGRLGANWDSYGAAPVDPNVIAAARALIRSLPENIAYRPRVVPLSSGGLQFEWHEGTKVLELELENPQTIHYLQWHPERQVEEEDSFPVTDREKVIDLIQWFMSGTCV